MGGKGPLSSSRNAGASKDLPPVPFKKGHRLFDGGSWKTIVATNGRDGEAPCFATPEAEPPM
eukprot:8070322-Lingulodinium_polyedra.AAC.1